MSMFDLCKSRREYIGEMDDIRRAFALIGVMREIGDSVPNDLAYLYVDAMGPSCFSRIFYNHDVTTGSGSTVTEMGRDTDRAGNEYAHLAIPEAIRRMARNYLIRCYWTHVNMILDTFNPYASKERTSNRPFETSKMFPDYVRTAIDVLNVSDNFGILDIKHEIDVFYAAINPIKVKTSIKCAGTNVKDIYTKVVSGKPVDSSYAPLNPRQFAKINALHNILYSYIAKLERGSLPGAYEKGIFCSILEIFILLFATAEFDRVRKEKQIYEFALDEATEIGMLGKFTTEDSDSDWSDDSDTGSIDSALVTYSKLTPEAAICLGRNVCIKSLLNKYTPNRLVTNNVASTLGWLANRERSKESRIVKLFLLQELSLQRDNLRLFMRETGYTPSGDSGINIEDIPLRRL